MIEARVVEGHGHWQLTVTGHADEAVCAAVTAVQQSTAIFLEQLAELRPEELSITFDSHTGEHS